MKFLQAGRKVSFPSLMAWFYLKDKLLEQKIVAEGSCPDIKEPWKVWGKIDSWFPIQSRKSCANFFQAGQKVRISNSMGFFCFFSFFWFNQKLRQRFYLVTLKGHGNFGRKLNPGFQFSQKQNWVKFLGAGKKVKILNFIGWICLKDKLLEQKIDTAVSCPDIEEL